MRAAVNPIMIKCDSEHLGVHGSLKSHPDSPFQLRCDDIMKKKTKHSISSHGPVWITLNSFIWNIKTMKHKPSTKSDSYKCRIIRLLKMNRLHWKTSFFLLFEWLSRYTEQTVKCEHDNAIYTLKILSDSRKKGKGKTRKEQKKGEKSRRNQKTAIFV